MKVKIPRRAWWAGVPISAALAAVLVVSLFGAGGGTTGASTNAKNLAELHHLKAIMAREGLNGGDPDAPGVRHGGPEAPVSNAEQEAYLERALPAGDIPAGGYANGINASNYVTEIPANMGWRQLGPVYAPNADFSNPVTGASTPVSGRVSALAVVPSTCSASGCGTIYVGAANGGVWKTTDGGKTWTVLTDRQLSLAVGAITLDPVNPNIVYVGTGEANGSCDSQHGIGILRSTDGGATWTTLGFSQFVNRSVSDIIVDPRTAGTTDATLYVSDYSGVNNNSTTEACTANASPYLPTRGVFVSKDGGQSWTNTLPIRTQSLVMDPNDPNTLYAGASFSGVWKTTDDGQHWTQLTNGLPSGGFDRLTLAVAPSNAQVLYVSYDLNGAQALFKSTNGGASWTQQSNTPDACDGQCWYDMPLAVDPTNADTVYAGGSANYGYLFGSDPGCFTFSPLAPECNAQMMKTTDGGATWADTGENLSSATSGPIHPDDHVIVVAPGYHNVVYTGNDGGVFYSTDGGATWTDLNKGLATLQFQGLAVGPTGEIFAGTQDNGTFMYSGSTTWSHVNGGDGGPTAADPTNANVSYNSYYGAQLFRNDNNGDRASDTWIMPFWGDFFEQGRGQFYEPYALAPSAPSDIFYGTYRVWRSMTRGGTDGNGDGDATNDPSDTSDWVPITPDLHANVTAVAVSSTDPNVVAVATRNGKVYLTTNALAPVTTDQPCTAWLYSDDSSHCRYVSGPSWTEIDSGLPNRFATAVKFAPGSTSTLYVTYSGFDENSAVAGHVFVSTNSGASWTNIDGAVAKKSIPDLPVNDIVINPQNGHLYVAADYGVFFSPNGGATWQRMDFGLPNSPVYQMQIDTVHHGLVVATHGRGIWEGNLP